MSYRRAISEVVILLEAGGDVEIYQSRREAARSIEPVDAFSGDYSAYDIDGRPLAFRPRGRDDLYLVDLDQPPEVDHVADRVRRFILTVGPERYGTSREAVEQLALHDLLMIATMPRLRPSSSQRSWSDRVSSALAALTRRT